MICSGTAESQNSRVETPSGSPGSLKDANLARRQSPAFLHIRRKSQPLEPEEVKITAENPSVDEVGQVASPSNQDQASFIFEPSIYDKIRMPTPQSNNLGSGKITLFLVQSVDWEQIIKRLALVLARKMSI